MAYTTPRTWVAGEVLTAAQLNEQIRDNLTAAFPLGVGAWTDYTPSLTNVTQGNGTVAARYAQFGTTVHFRFKLTFGSSTAFTGSPEFTLPVTASEWIQVVGSGYAIDANGPNYLTHTYLASDTNFRNVLDSQASTAALNATVPFTWASGDILVCFGTYEAA